MKFVLAASIAALLAGCSPSPPPAQHAAHPAPAAAPMDSSATPADRSAIQTRLRDAGFYHGPVDGKWGKQTEAALRAYQKDRKLDVTGKMNPDTHSKLYP